ncbi:hypothetical protein VNO78_28775 [Psophocarpus tetragonolobus]|uniref:Uncharacterized protein n=1 Tax=Psophocarpus tetragonolobus TaxID=3891 RepID=A0AAN9RTU7_PSOTE
MRDGGGRKTQHACYERDAEGRRRNLEPDLNLERHSIWKQHAPVKFPSLPLHSIARTSHVILFHFALSRDTRIHRVLFSMVFWNSKSELHC